jgi:SAM-dependent methyltransferase
MQPDEVAVGAGYEKGLAARGPFGWYMRWYLRRRRPIEVPTILQAVGAGPYPRVLDAGCGTGLRLADMYRRGHRRRSLAGVDVSTMMAQETRDRLAGVVGPGTRVRVENCSAVELPFDDKTFDLLMANAIVKHLDEERFARFLSEAHRVLASGGRISIWDFGRPLFKLPDVKVDNPALEMKNLRTSEVLMQRLTEAGFTQTGPYKVRRPWRMPVTFEGAVATRE